MKKKKVLLVIPKVSSDGVSKVLSQYVENFDDKIEAEIMTYEIENDIFFKNLDIKIFEIGSSKNFFQRVKKEIDILRHNKYDVVHINGNYCSRLFDCYAAKKAGVKRLIIHSHNTNSGSGNRIRMLIHLITKKMFDFFATDFFACSDEAAKWMFSRKIYKKKQYHFIKNGINVSAYKFDIKKREELRKKYNIDNKFVVGHVGRFQYQKNQDFLIDIFYDLHKKNSNSILLLIGEGPLEDKIKEKVRLLKLDNNVLFLGNKNDVYNYYNAMDCFVLPSFFEGLPIVCVEAQANGLYSFLSDEISKDSTITNDIKFISLSTTSSDWASIILNNKNTERGKAYKVVIKNGYDIKDVVKNLERLYDEE